MSFGLKNRTTFLNGFSLTHTQMKIHIGVQVTTDFNRIIKCFSLQYTNSTFTIHYTCYMNVLPAKVTRLSCCCRLEYYFFFMKWFLFTVFAAQWVKTHPVWSWKWNRISRWTLWTRPANCFAFGYGIYITWLLISHSGTASSQQQMKLKL